MKYFCCGFCLVLMSGLLFNVVGPRSVLFNIVGIRYPHVIEYQPLKDPKKVVSIVGNRLTLEDGRVIEVEQDEDRDLRGRLSQSGFMVDVEALSNGEIIVCGNQNGWICGTSWAQPIRIPLIPQTVYRNRREAIAWGKLAANKADAAGSILPFDR